MQNLELMLISFFRQISFPAISFIGDFLVDNETKNHLYRVEESFYLYIFLRKQLNLKRMIDLVKNDTEKLYYVLTQNAVCQDNYKFRFVYESYNITQTAFHFIKKHSTVDWFKDQFATWNQKNAPVFSEIVTKRGVAFTFNMIPAEILFNLDQ